MGRLFYREFSKKDRGGYYKCVHCGLHLARDSDWKSGNFRGRTGPASLFDHVLNVSLGPSEESQMITGQHTIMKLYCIGCTENVGWKYVRAQDEKQKYKEGKFILEEELWDYVDEGVAHNEYAAEMEQIRGMIPQPIITEPDSNYHDVLLSPRWSNHEHAQAVPVVTSDDHNYFLPEPTVPQAAYATTGQRTQQLHMTSTIHAPGTEDCNSGLSPPQTEETTGPPSAPQTDATTTTLSASSSSDDEPS